MGAELMRTLGAYNRWANNLLWECVAQLSDEQFEQDVDFSRGAIKRQIMHILMVEFNWPAVIWEGVSFEELKDKRRALDLSSRAAMLATWNRIADRLQARLDAVDEVELARPITYDWGDDQERTHSIEQILTQVFMHSLDHRAQIMAVLHDWGIETFSQDLIHYLREHQNA